MADAPAQACPDCFKGGLLKGEPKGSMAKIAGLDTYFTAQGGASESSDKVIVLFSDIFGFGIPNAKLQSDLLSELTGLPVYAPDLLEGDWPPTHKLEGSMVDEPMTGLSFFARTTKLLGLAGSFIRHIGPAFFIRHRPAVVNPLATRFIAAVRAEKGASKVAVVGFCFGGSASLALTGAEGQPDVYVVAHPGACSKADFERIDRPFFLINSSEDIFFDTMKPTAFAVLQTKQDSGLAIQNKTYDGTAHGFACRPYMSNPIIVKAWEQSTQDSAGWIKANL